MWQMWWEPKHCLNLVFSQMSSTYPFYPSSPLFSPCLSFFIPLRNQAMRKKLILYFKRRNHARKQWVSRELDIFDSLLGLSPWRMTSVKLGQLLLEVSGHFRKDQKEIELWAWSVVSTITVPWGSGCFWNQKQIVSYCHLKEKPRFKKIIHC